MFKMMIQVLKNNIGILFIESLRNVKQDTKGSLYGGLFDMYRRNNGSFKI